MYQHVTYLDGVRREAYDPQPLRQAGHVAQLALQLLSEAGLDHQLPGEVLHQLTLKITQNYTFIISKVN